MDAKPEETNVSEGAPSERGEHLSALGQSALRGELAEGRTEQAEAPEMTTIGDPVHDAQFYRPQERDDTCAEVSQGEIINKHTGEELSESQLRKEAIESGAVRYANTPFEGTDPSAVGDLLDAHGVPTKRWENANADMLRRELDQRHDVIVGVDAGDLWQDDRYLGTGHAVWLTGMEQDNEGRYTRVFLNDSGNPDIDGGGAVQFDNFHRAWDARGSPMVATQQAAPGYGGTER